MDESVHQQLVKAHLKRAQSHCQECQKLHEAMAEHFGTDDSTAAGLHEALSVSYGDFSGHITNTLASFEGVPTHDEGGSPEELRACMKVIEGDF